MQEEQPISAVKEFLTESVSKITTKAELDAFFEEAAKIYEEASAKLDVVCDEDMEKISTVLKLVEEIREAAMVRAIVNRTNKQCIRDALNDSKKPRQQKLLEIIAGHQPTKRPPLSY